MKKIPSQLSQVIMNPVTLDKIHSVYQKIYQFTEEQTLTSIQQCLKNMQDADELFDRLEKEKLGNNMIQSDVDQLLKKNRKIIDSTQSQLTKWLRVINDNILHFSQDPEIRKNFKNFEFFTKNISKSEVLLPKVNSFLDEGQLLQVRHDTRHLQPKTVENEILNNLIENNNLMVNVEDQIDKEILNKQAEVSKRNSQKIKELQNQIQEETKQVDHDSETIYQKQQRLNLQRMEKIYLEEKYNNIEIDNDYEEMKKQVNKDSAALVIVCINKMYQIVLEYGNKLLDDTILMSPKALKRFFIHCSKVYISDIMVYIAMQMPCDDLFYLNEDHPDWDLLQNHYALVEFADDNRVIESYKSFSSLVALGNAFVSKGYIHENKFKKYVTSSVYATYYFFFKQKRLEQNDYFCANPDLNLAREIWNLLETPYIKAMFQTFLPSIKINKKIFIPMLDTQITLDNFNNLPQYDHASKRERKPLRKLVSDSIEDNISTHDEKLNKVIFGIKSRHYNPNTHVKVRVLSAIDLPLDLNTGLHQKLPTTGSFKNLSCSCLSFCCKPDNSSKQKEQDETKIKKLVIHIHGGGFVSMSSGSHQNYTRIWANQLKVPIISIDYRLSPQYQFPSAINDVWQVYYWLVENAETELGIKPEKIVIIGDSAGGNLTAALTVMAIERNYRVPDGIILAYPALNLSRLNFTPSLLLALDDPILPYPFLRMCLESYIGASADPSHPYISPSLADPEVHKKFPKTRIMIASNDPLRDESFRFTLKLAKLGVDIQLKEFKLMPHGFLSYTFPIWGMKQESLEGINQGTQWIKEIFDDQPDLLANADKVILVDKKTEKDIINPLINLVEESKHDQ